MCRGDIISTKRSFSKVCLWNHQKFQNSHGESSKVCMWDHQDNYFLINVACRSDANLIKWQFSPVSSCRRWFEVILWCIYYVMSCVRPQLGADCFHPKWAVDSSYSWNVHCFQIWWRSHRSAGIGIEKQLGKPSQCCNESGKYCPRLQPTTKTNLPKITW